VSPTCKKREVRLFFRFDFVIEAAVDEATDVARSMTGGSTAAVRRLGDSAFPPISRTIWISDDGEIPTGQTLKELTRPYDRDLADANLNQDRWSQIGAHYSLANWPNRCRRAYAAAAKAVVAEVELAKYTAEHAKVLERQTAIVRDQYESRIAALTNGGLDTTSAETELAFDMKLRHALLSGLRQHITRLDAAGAVFLAGIPLA
jgi:hypothetical protein